MQKSAVMTLGNSLVKQGMNRSQALKTAWKMVKQGQFYTKAAGVSYGNRQEALERLTKYTADSIKINLVREDNEFDPQAVAIMVSVNDGKQYKLGYLARQIAALWYRLVEKNFLTATMTQITGGNTKNYGVNLNLQLIA